MFRRLFRYLLYAVLFLLLISVLVLVFVSPAQTTGVPIAAIERPVINGVPQGIIIRGTDTSRPVLLFVHGGPGMPSYSYLSNEFKNGMEKLFTVCYWDQRGAGLSYTGNTDTSGMNLAQLVKDGVAVSQYLRKKFNKQKIYLLGHSWGTWLGSFIVRSNPELYYAYIGIGQLGNPYASETASRNFVLEKAAKQGDEEMLRNMQQYPLPPITADGKTWERYLLVERQYVFALGGARHGKKRTKLDIAREILFCREYSVRDKWNYEKGLFFSQNTLWPAMIRLDLNVELPEQSIPVYIFQGIHDHQTDYTLAKAYFDHLKAPEKKFYTFSSSAHSPHLEEYDLFESILRKDVLMRR
jgi:pimeloyl-ACP methyl ester carboxylesterase